MTFQGWNIGFIIICKFAISTIGNAQTLTMVPHKTTFGPRSPILTLIDILAATAAITRYPCFFGIIVGISSRAPIVTVGTYFGTDKEIVQYHKIAGQCVVIGGYFFGK